MDQGLCIQIKQIEKCFRQENRRRLMRKNVLDGVSFEVKEGEIFTLLGPSGAGKTTLVRIMTGQLNATKGECLVFGEPSSKKDPQILKQIGIVLDNSGVYERLSCIENLRLFARLYQIPIAMAEVALEEVGLKDARKTLASHLSKGMRQRLVLARAIMHHPKLLFLDEPTSGLDPAASRGIHRLLLRRKEEGTTIFLTTHDMEEARILSDHVALLDEGKIVEYGRPDEICRKYNKQNQITIVTKENEQIQIKNCLENSETIADYFIQGDVQVIHSSEPDLGTVFLTLTGKGLEE